MQLFEDLLRKLPTRTKRYRAETVCSISDSKMPALLFRMFRGGGAGLFKQAPISLIYMSVRGKSCLAHSRHGTAHNFVMNLYPSLSARCFFDGKPEAVPVCVGVSRQLSLSLSGRSCPGLVYLPVGFAVYPSFFSRSMSVATPSVAGCCMTSMWRPLAGTVTGFGSMRKTGAEGRV